MLYIALSQRSNSGLQTFVFHETSMQGTSDYSEPKAKSVSVSLPFHSDVGRKRWASWCPATGLRREAKGRTIHCSGPFAICP